MKLTSEQAMKMHKEFESKMEDTHWIKHSICVGNSAGKNVINN